MAPLPFSRISTRLTTEEKLAVVSIEDVRRWCRIDFDVEDDIIAFCIESAYDWLIDRYLNGCVLLTETFEVTFDGLGSGFNQLELPLRPVIPETLDSFEVLTAGSYTPVVSSTYALRKTDQFPIVARVGFGAWSYGRSTFRLRFKAGFGGPEDIPTNLKHAIRLLAKHFYDNREMVTAEKLQGAIRYGLADLCSPYRLALDHS